MNAAAATVAVVILAALAILQGLVAGGKPYGCLVWGGQHETLPRRLRIGSALAIPLYAVIGWALLARTGLVGSSSTAIAVAAWVIVVYFVTGVALNGISRSHPERLVMTPTCIVLAVCSLLVALG